MAAPASSTHRSRTVPRRLAATARRAPVPAGLVACIVLSGLVSCRSPKGLIPMFPDRTKQKGIIALYEAPGGPVPATGSLFRQVPDINGRTVTVKAFPALWSVHFVRGAVARDQHGRPALALQLDYHASLMWAQVRRRASFDTLAVCVDGVIRWYVSISDLDTGEGDWILIPGPWKPDELKSIARKVESNYKALKRRR